MPLYVDTNDVQFQRWPKIVLNSIEQMRVDAEDSTVGSMYAAKLFVRYLIQLDPDLNAEEIFKLQWISWRALEDAGKKLELDGAESANRVREYLGITLCRLQEWSRNSGRRTGKYHTYCSLCWRHAVEGQKFCYAHNPQHNEAAYRKARRMLLQAGSIQDKSVSIQTNLRDWLIGQREIDRVEANEQWQNVLDGQMLMVDWLRKYRTRVFEKIGGNQIFCNISTKMILERLDGEVTDETSVQLKTAREQLYHHIEQRPDELYGLLRRAEVILAIEKYFTKTRPHGGARCNAGRPKSHSRKKTSRTATKLGIAQAIECC